jgi:hypothetical protein
MATKKPTLGYWRYRAFGQPIRTLLTYTGTEVEEVIWEREAWYGGA